MFHIVFLEEKKRLIHTVFTSRIRINKFVNGMFIHNFRSILTFNHLSTCIILYILKRKSSGESNTDMWQLFF